MKIEVIRPETCGASCTIGEMYVDGVFKCYTLEDVVRPAGEKVFGETAIPFGTYRVDITHSPHFDRDLPLLLEVPDFSGVRIHPGNTAADTEGCILVGLGKTEDTITQSRLAFDGLFTEIRDAIEHGEEVWVEVK
jgi:hypothetical protein